VAVLAVLHALVAQPTPLHETLSIAGASVFGGVTRFLLLRSWVFTPRPAPPPVPAPGATVVRPSMAHRSTHPEEATR
jgi:hypothetical protein